MKTILTDKVIDSPRIKPVENDKGVSVKTMRAKRPFLPLFSPFLKIEEKYHSYGHLWVIFHS